MIELTVLGPQALRRDDGHEFGSLPAQPKRFALLAYLAIDGSGGYHRRDTLAAVFWPDLDQFAARRALRNTLYHLREALGDGVIVTRGDDVVAVDPTMLTSDVARLATAVAEERYEAAVDHYRGELLAGMHFANAGDAFEDWLGRERARVLDLVMRAIRALVERETRAGNVLGAAYWAQRACALAPGDEGWLRQSMSLLAEGDDRGGALRLYESYARRLAAEFDAAPSALTVMLAERIRAGSIARPATPTVAPATAPLLVDETATADALPSLHASRPSPRRRVAAWAAAIAIVGLALIAWTTRARHAEPTHERTRVLVAVFDNRTGDPRLQMLGRMAADWLTQGILQTQLVDVVDPRAVFVQGRTPAGAAVDPVTLGQRTGAALVVSGSYYRTGDSLLFQAALVDARTGRIARMVGPIGTTVDRPTSALDALRSRVMTALAAATDARISGVLSVDGEIPAYDAYESYMEGWDAFWHGDGRHAEELFTQAVRRDTTFVAAAVSAATAASNFHHCARVDSIVGAIDAQSRPITRLDRLSLRIAIARCRGQNEEMLRLTLERADLEPRTSSLRLPAAAAALWADRPTRALTLLQGMNPATDLGWSRDPTHFAYWSGLTEALHLLGRHDDELAAADRIPRTAPLNRAWMRGRALAALSRPREVLALIDTALTLPVETANDLGLAPYTDGRPQYDATAGWVATWIARELMVHGEPAAGRQAAARALVWYRRRPPEDRATSEERLVAVWSLELLGAYDDANQIARGLVSEDTANVDYHGVLAALAVERGDSARADSLDRWLAAQHGARVGWSASFYRARDAVLQGQRDSAVVRVREALDAGAWPLWLHLEPTLVSLRERRDYIALTTPRD